MYIVKTNNTIYTFLLLSDNVDERVIYFLSVLLGVIFIFKQEYQIPFGSFVKITHSICYPKVN